MWKSFHSLHIKKENGSSTSGRPTKYISMHSLIDLIFFMIVSGNWNYINNSNRKNSNPNCSFVADSGSIQVIY